MPALLDGATFRTRAVQRPAMCCRGPGQRASSGHVDTGCHHCRCRSMGRVAGPALAEYAAGRTPGRNRRDACAPQRGVHRLPRGRWSKWSRCLRGGRVAPRPRKWMRNDPRRFPGGDLCARGASRQWAWWSVVAGRPIMGARHWMFRARVRRGSREHDKPCIPCGDGVRGNGTRHLFPNALVAQLFRHAGAGIFGAVIMLPLDRQRAARRGRPLCVLVSWPTGVRAPQKVSRQISFTSRSAS